MSSGLMSAMRLSCCLAARRAATRLPGRVWPPPDSVDRVLIGVDRLVVDDHAVDDVERDGVAVDRRDATHLDLHSAAGRAAVVRLDDCAGDLALERVLDRRAGTWLTSCVLTTATALAAFCDATVVATPVTTCVSSRSTSFWSAIV